MWHSSKVPHKIYFSNLVDLETIQVSNFMVGEPLCNLEGVIALVLVDSEGEYPESKFTGNVVGVVDYQWKTIYIFQKYIIPKCKGTSEERFVLVGNRHSFDKQTFQSVPRYCIVFCHCTNVLAIVYHQPSVLSFL